MPQPTQRPNPGSVQNMLPPVQGPVAPPQPVQVAPTLQEIRNRKRMLLAQGRRLLVQGASSAQIRNFIDAHRALRGEERFYEDMDRDGIPDA